jgi:hypothetical protein
MNPGCGEVCITDKSKEDFYPVATFYVNRATSAKFCLHTGNMKWKTRNKE